MATFKWNCPHPQCRAQRSAFRTIETVTYSQNDGTTYVPAQCGVCFRPVMFEIESIPAAQPTVVGMFRPNFQQDPFSPSGLSILRQNGIQEVKVKRTLPEPPPIVAPEHVPGPVEAAFLEGLQARDAGLLPSAVYNIRKCLERAVRDRDPAGTGFLKARIKKLETDNKIPPTLVDLAHTVRAEGNVEVHEDEEWTPEQVEELIDFARLFFTYLYTLPARIDAIAAKRGKPADQR
jgi:hypothetical protein